MKTYLEVKTNGDPLDTIRGLIVDIWSKFALAGMLVPSVDADSTNPAPRLLTDPAELNSVNPFEPLMHLNLARTLPEFMNDTRFQRIGILMRSCEVRALKEVQKRNPVELKRLLIVCIDCLGTFPAQEYIWRFAGKDSSQDLAQKSLRFARQGGILGYRNRIACQICAAPGAEGADVNLGVMGLPVREYLLIHATDQSVIGKLRENGMTSGYAARAMVDQYERMLIKVGERHQHSRGRLLDQLDDIHPQNLDAFIDLLESCVDCEACMEACPICVAEMPRRRVDGHFVREDVANWLRSCVNCGMCEQACPSGLPMSLIFANVRERLEVL